MKSKKVDEQEMAELVEEVLEKLQMSSLPS